MSEIWVFLGGDIQPKRMDSLHDFFAQFLIYFCLGVWWWFKQQFSNQPMIFLFQNFQLGNYIESLNTIMAHAKTRIS